MVSAILLAAGLSRRFGRPKQLAELEGAALVRRALATLERAPVDEIVVVVGHRAADVAKAFPETEAKVVYNEDYREGIGSSLKRGLAELDGDSSAVLVCLADQPFVTPVLIARIVSRYRRTGADVVASYSNGHVSPPVLFSSGLYGEIAKLRSDRGARAIIDDHPGYEKVRARPSALLDVDTEDDLERAESILKLGAVRRGARARGGDAASRVRLSSGTRRTPRRAGTRRSG